MAADGIDFVDEDDARSILLALLEQITNAAGADADEHFDEVRTRDGEERHVRLARDGSRKQRFARSRRSDQQNALRNSPAELLKFLGFTEELNNFLQLFLGLLYPGNIFKCHLLLLGGVEPRPAFPETERFIPAAL